MSIGEIDPDTLLDWLQVKPGEEREMQQIALEQLCMLLLISDNIDRCFEVCPPRTFLPALCHIMIDKETPEYILEVAARAITYYLDVSAECTRRITGVDGAVKAICSRLDTSLAELRTNRTAKDLTEQCIKVLERICSRESGAVFDAGGLSTVLSFIEKCSGPEATELHIHKDTMHSAMTVVTRLCSKMEHNNPSLPQCVRSLSRLLTHSDPYVSDGALRCFATLADRFSRRSIDPAPLAEHGLIEELLNRLTHPSLVQSNTSFLSTSLNSSTGLSSSTGSTPGKAKAPSDLKASQQTISTVTSLMSTLCRESPTITHNLLRSNLTEAIQVAIRGDERIALDTMRFTDLILILIFNGRKALPNSSSSGVLPTTATAQPPAMLIPPTNSPNSGESRPNSGNSTPTNQGSTLKTILSKKLEPGTDRYHRNLIDSIRRHDTDAVTEAIDAGNVEVNFTDDVGQTLLNWASAFGTNGMVEFLCNKGADVNKGQRLSSLHYAACFGRPNIAKTLLRHGANPELRDEDGSTPLDKARERNDDGHRAVAHILQSPGEKPYIFKALINK